MDFINELLLIAQGRIWSEEFDVKAHDLAIEIETEFNNINSQNK